MDCRWFFTCWWQMWKNKGLSNLKDADVSLVGDVLKLTWWWQMWKYLLTLMAMMLMREQKQAAVHSAAMAVHSLLRASNHSSPCITPVKKVVPANQHSAQQKLAFGLQKLRKKLANQNSGKQTLAFGQSEPREAKTGGWPIKTQESRTGGWPIRTKTGVLLNWSHKGKIWSFTNQNSGAEAEKTGGWSVRTGSLACESKTEVSSTITQESKDWRLGSCSFERKNSDLANHNSGSLQCQNAETEKLELAESQVQKAKIEGHTDSCPYSGLLCGPSLLARVLFCSWGKKSLTQELDVVLSRFGRKTHKK